MSDQPRCPGFSTLAIHAGAPPESAARVCATSSYPATCFDGLDAAASRFGSPDLDEGGASLGNAPNTVLEERIAALEGGPAAVAVASGHAAQMVAFQTLMQPGDEFIASRRICGASIDRFNETFKRFGWVVRWADPEHPESFAAAITEKTRAIFIESIAHPGGYITDIEAIAAVARPAKVPLIVDNTLATPYLIKPLDHGADIIIHSTTRFLGGHGTAGGGFIVDGGSFDWLGDARYPVLSAPCPRYGNMVLGETFGNFAFAVACRALGLRDLGLAQPALDAVLTLAGIETLPLRMQRHCDNALAVANHLVRHPAVHWVNYAGLPGDPKHALQQRYAPSGAGAVFTFGIAGGPDAAVRMVRKLKLFAHRAHLGGTRSLVVPPASTAPRPIEDGGRIASGVNRDAIQLSIGLEDKEDLLADLDQALAI